MKKFLFGFIAIIALAVIVPAVLVLLNKLPLVIADRLSFVKTYTVSGQVRMADGTSKPEADVALDVTTSGGKSANASATKDNAFAYSVTFMGFTDPVRAGDTIHVRATMTLPDSLAAQTVTDEPHTAIVLLAEIDREVHDEGGRPLDPANEVFRNLRLRTWAKAPTELTGWEAIRLASLANLANPANPALQHVGIDDEIDVVGRFQSMSYPDGAMPFRPRLPDADTREELRAILLVDVGEDLVREDFLWEKKRASVPFSFTAPGTVDISVLIMDSVGGETRLERLGNISRTGMMDWAWDGRNSSGDYAPEGPYTFVALAGGFAISAEPKQFVAEIRGRGATRRRYAEFDVATTVGEFLDTLALGLDERTTADGGIGFELAESVRLFDSTAKNDPRTVTRRLRGSDTVATFVSAFGLAIDPVARQENMTRLGRYRLVVKGGKIQISKPFKDFESIVPVNTREEFLALPLSRVYAIEGSKKQPVVGERPLEMRIIQPKDDAELEDWEIAGTHRPIPPVVVSATDSLSDILDRLNAIPEMSASVRGTIDVVPEYDARIAGANGERVTLFRGETAEPGSATVNVRAAGIHGARPILNAVRGTLTADGATTVPVEAGVVALDGTELGDDVLTAKVSAGTIRNLRSSDGVYRGIYSVPQTTSDVIVTLELASKALGEAHDKQTEGTVVLHRTSFTFDVAGGEPVATSPADTNGGVVVPGARKNKENTEQGRIKAR
jgi:hypothetical protein